MFKTVNEVLKFELPPKKKKKPEKKDKTKTIETLSKGETDHYCDYLCIRCIIFPDYSTKKNSCTYCPLKLYN